MQCFRLRFTVHESSQASFCMYDEGETHILHQSNGRKSKKKEQKLRKKVSLLFVFVSNLKQSISLMQCSAVQCSVSVSVCVVRFCFRILRVYSNRRIRTNLTAFANVGNSFPLWMYQTVAAGRRE